MDFSSQDWKGKGMQISGLEACTVYIVSPGQPGLYTETLLKKSLKILHRISILLFSSLNLT